MVVVAVISGERMKKKSKTANRNTADAAKPKSLGSYYGLFPRAGKALGFLQQERNKARLREDAQVKAWTRLLKQPSS